MNKKKQNKNLFCKIQPRFVSPPISRLLRHAGGHVGPILLPRTHRGTEPYMGKMVVSY